LELLSGKGIIQDVECTNVGSGSALPLIKIALIPSQIPDLVMGTIMQTKNQEKVISFD